jgi:hypothetical protein
MKQIVKESVNIYNELRPHYSNYMLTPNKMHLQSQNWEHIKQKRHLQKTFLQVFKSYFV